MNRSWRGREPTAPITVRHEPITPGHLEQLEAAMPDCRIFEGRGSVAYPPHLTAPYYFFIGRKR